MVSLFGFTMVSLLGTSIISHSILAGSLLGLIYAFLFVWEKKAHYRNFNESSNKNMVYSSVTASLLRALFVGGAMIGTIRFFNLSLFYVLGSFVIGYLVGVVLITKGINEH